MSRLIFFVIYAALGAYLVFSVLQFRDAFLAAAERTSASQRMRLETESRLRERPRTLLFAGDIMLSRAVGRAMERAQDPFYTFRRIAEVTRAADFTFGNLENPISDRGTLSTAGYAFRAEPDAVRGLAFAGFDALSVANNHIFDYGREAYEDTVARLRANGIEPIAGEPHGFTLGDTRVTLLAYTTLLGSFDEQEVIRAIQSFHTSNIQHPTSNFVIVSLHWGEEYAPQPSGAQRELARRLVDAGADLIVGHHPHVAQEVERYKDGYIAYSLGNFVFDQNFSEKTMRGLMLKVVITDDKIVRVEKVPIKINATFQPELALPDLF